MNDLDAIYTEDWFRGDFTPLIEEFKIAGEALDRMFAPTTARSAVDIGSGPGLLLRALVDRGWWDVVAFDGSPHAQTIALELGGVPPFIFDVTTGMVPTGTRELVICTELAEHIPEESASTLVRMLADLTTHACVFTAAPPGQEGHHHVNLQYPHYWERQFARCGMFLDTSMTGELRMRWAGLEKLVHMAQNVMVFR